MPRIPYDKANLPNFYSEVRVIRFCQICDIRFELDSPKLGQIWKLCYVHREEFFKQRKKMKYKEWKAWVRGHKDRRRAIALDNYHKNKHKVVKDAAWNARRKEIKRKSYERIGRKTAHEYYLSHRGPYKKKCKFNPQI